MLEVRELKAPKDIRDSEERAAERVAVFLKANLKRLSPERVEKIEQKLHKWWTAYHKQTDVQRKRLVRYAELLEGVVEDLTTPFEGASNVTTHYAAGMARTFRANYNKTAYFDEHLWFPIFSPDLQKIIDETPGLAQNLEEGFNESWSRGCNGLRTMKDATVPCVRDGTTPISGIWRREVRRVFDQRTYRSVEAFQKDYPDAASAFGEGDEASAQYAEVIDFFLAHGDVGAQAAGGEAPPQGQEQAPTPPASTDAPELIVSFEYDMVYKNEPEYRIGPWAKFARYPLSARSIAECQLYGYEVAEDREAIKLRLKRKEFYEAGVNKVLQHKAQNNPDGWDKAVGFVEGITPPSAAEDQPVRYIDGCCLLDLDDDGVPEKYQVKFAPAEKALLALTPHRLRRGIDNAVPFRMVRRENRLDGVSLIGDCEDLFNQIDLNVRHRNNVRILTTSPVFLANAKYKDQIDLGRAENVVRPGVTYWVDDPDKAIKQMQLQDLSTTMDNVDELKMYKEHVELVFGPTQGMSGMQTPNDPRAPARKTQLLMNQAGGRMDDYIDEFMSSAPDLADLHAALLFQYSDGSEIIQPVGGRIAKFPKEILAHPGLRWGVKRRSMQLTPEFTMARLGNLQALYQQLLPRLSVLDPIAIELWNRHVLASGEPRAEKFTLALPKKDAQGQPEQQQDEAAQRLMNLAQIMGQAMQMNPKNPVNEARAAGMKKTATEMAKAGVKHLTGQISPIGR